MEDMPITAKKNVPTCRVCVAKDVASGLKVGSSVDLSLSGEVKSLMPSYDGKDMYEIEIENPSIEIESGENEEPDETYATMPKEKLKGIISKPE